MDRALRASAKLGRPALPPRAARLLSKEAAAWFERQSDSAPEFFRPVLKAMLANLAAGQVSRKQFNTFSRELGRALEFIRSSERWRSGDPLGASKVGVAGKPRDERERLEQRRDRCSALIDRQGELRDSHQSKLDKLNERMKKMADKAEQNAAIGIELDISLEQIALCEGARARNKVASALTGPLPGRSVNALVTNLFVFTR